MLDDSPSGAAGARRPRAGHVRVPSHGPAWLHSTLMDLHVIGPLASPAERAAVDAVLGPPESGWVGGPRDSGTDGHAARGGHATRSRRSLLIPALHAVQSRIGWISTPALNYVCKRLAVAPAEAYGVATFYALFATTPRPPLVAHVCDDIACRLAGAEAICADLTRAVGPAGEPARDGRATWLRSPCLGLCDRAPAAMFTIAGETPSTFTLAPIDAVGVDRRSSRPDDGSGVRQLRRTSRSRPSSGRACSAGSASSTRRRSTTTGPTAATRLWPAPSRSGPERVIAEVTDSRLLGRGGAAFPTGRKWAAVAAQAAQPHYLVCNADESEPGTFKDRVLLEGDPFATVEAMTIAAFATGASKGYLYIRGEYPEAEARVANAIDRARERRPPRRRHPGLGLRLRHRAPARRRRLHLRRGDGALRVDRGQARRAAQQAAVPGRGRPVRQADGRQQRRDAGQRAAHRARRRRGVRPDRHRGLDRPEALLPVGPRRAARASTRSSSGRRCAT